jgi:hypothetical protein
MWNFLHDRLKIDDGFCEGDLLKLFSEDVKNQIDLAKFRKRCDYLINEMKKPHYEIRDGWSYIPIRTKL